MRKLAFLLLGVCLLQTGLANHNLNIPPNSNPLNLRISNHFKEIVPFNEVKKKQTLKQRLLMKWYRHKMKSTADENQKKKIVKTMGQLSLGSAILMTILLLTLSLLTAETAITVFVITILALIPTSIILGILSLSKRKKLADKSGTSNVPAIIGIAIGSLFFLLLVFTMISFTVSGF